MKKRNLILVLGCLFLTAISLQGQVTVGTDETAVDGALLQIKSDKSVTNGDLPNSTKGVAFPRVELTQKKELNPMFAGATTAAQKSSHTGLVVFNIKAGTATDDPTFKFEKGLYVWKGTEWAAVGSVPEVGNGLRVHNDSIKWGGTLTDVTTTIDLGKNNLVFENVNTPDPNTKREAGLMLKNLETIPTSTMGLVVDVNTGRVGLNVGVPARLLFYQSATESYLRGDSGTGQLALATAGTTTPNNGNRTYIIPWDESADEFTNNILEFIPSENAFQVPDTVTSMTIEVSGYVGYIANQTAGGGTGSNENGTTSKPTTIVNAAIQIAAWNETAGDWDQYENWTSMRGLISRDFSYYRQTLSIPPALYVAKAKDRIRLVVIPSPDGLGADHGNPRIVRPFGTNISKAIKIIVQ